MQIPWTIALVVDELRVRDYRSLGHKPVLKQESAARIPINKVVEVAVIQTAQAILFGDTVSSVIDHDIVCNHVVVADDATGFISVTDEDPSPPICEDEVVGYYKMVARRVDP